jgi:hypothetical protein
MTKNEELAALDAVAAVLVDKLHTTEDEELQAGLIQLMDYAGGLELMVQRARQALGI